MKKIYSLMLVLLMVANVFAQIPDKLSYQAVVRNSANQLLVNKSVGIRINILENRNSETSIYSETFTTNTNSNGLISIEIGGNESFSNIHWEEGAYFLQTEIDPEGGSNYSITVTHQLLSVPYALHAKTAENLTNPLEETDPFFTAWNKSTGIVITESQISDLQNYLLTEIDPSFSAWDKSSGIVIVENQITDLQNYITTELDPVYTSSIAAGISEIDTARWNEMLSQETDPHFNSWDKSSGIVITENQISNLQNYLIAEIDPIFAAWDKTTGIVITENQISDLQSYITEELDPIYAASIAAGITASDTANWNAKLFQEVDPQFNAWDKTTDIEISESQITDLQNYVIIENDPIYAASVASGITEADTAHWNAKIDSFSETQTLADVANISNLVNTQIKNMSDPTDAQDAATKSYIDSVANLLNTAIAALDTRLVALENHLPIVKTSEIVYVSGTTAQTGGVVVTNGGSNITACGVCWSTSENPTLVNNHTLDTLDSNNNFESTITGLIENTTYYIRAYSININGTNYGDQKSFTTFIINGNGVTDVDGNTYNSVLINNKEWMVENLKTTKFNDGTEIPIVSDGEEWISINTPACCWHSNDSTNKEIYGALYNWYSVNTAKLCPTGWHVPSDVEWMNLRRHIGSPEGIKLRATHGWSDNGNGVDQFGFSALPAGFRYWNNYDFYSTGYRIFFWASSEGDTNNAWVQGIYYDSDGMHRSARNKHYGFSVRCVKD